MPSMKKIFNWSASTVEAEMVLKGQYTDPELDEIQKLFLDNLIRVTEVDELFKFVTAEEFRGKMKAWRESTTTSPSERHLGNYKLLITTIDRLLDEDERERLQQIQKDIMNCYLGVINYAIKHRYSLERWKTIMNNMVYKEPGNVKIHQLRVIHIYKADLVLIWGVKWRASMRNSVNERTIHRGQYGGLPGRDCTTITFLEEARLDYSTLTRYSYCNFDNDATACYNRILCTIASLCGRKYGIHKDVVFVHAKTLEEAEFKLKISTKMSDTSYKHCLKFPIHGTGQGSTNSPTIWCFVSSVLFQCHNLKAHGILFKSPEGEMIVWYHMIRFVDNSTCIVGSEKNDMIETLKEKMREDAQLWHDLLWVLGGKLELPKCGYHLVHYDFQPSGIPKMCHIADDCVILKNNKDKDVQKKNS